MVKVTTEQISNEIAEFIGPNWRDYRPVSEIVSVFVSTFGHYHIDDVPERIWAPWIAQQQLRDTVRNYPVTHASARPIGSTVYRDGVAGYVGPDHQWYPEALDF